jgi:uncharacterized membrane protein
MPQQRSWQKYTTLTSSLLLTATVLVASSFAADTNQRMILNSSREQISQEQDQKDVQERYHQVIKALTQLA